MEGYGTIRENSRPYVDGIRETGLQTANRREARRLRDATRSGIESLREFLNGVDFIVHS